MFKGIKDIRELARLQKELKYKFKVSIISEEQFSEALLLQKAENLQSEGYHIVSIFSANYRGFWILSKKSQLKGVDKK